MGILVLFMGTGNTEEEYYYIVESKMIIDREGNKLKVPRNISYIGYYSEGLFDVMIYEDGGFKYGYMNKDMEMVIKPVFKDVNPFKNGYARVVITYEPREQEALINKKGEIVYCEKDSTISDFSDEGLAIITYDDEREGIVNTKMEWVLKPQKKFMICEFFEGMAKVMNTDPLDRYFGFINTKGEVVIPMTYDSPGNFHEGVFLTGFSFINKKNERVLNDPGIEHLSNFFEGLSIAQNNGERIGFIDHSGKFVIEPIYTNLTRFVDGIAAASMSPLDTDDEDILWGFIDKSGKWIIEPAYRFGSPVIHKGGIAEVYIRENGKYDLLWIDIMKKGKVIFSRNRDMR